jgi:predicted ATPase
MIDYIKVNNFRTFGMNGKPAEFKLAPITILTGTNSSGKSSLIKLLQLLKANVPNNYSSLMELDFRKGNHKLFSMQNVMNQQGKPLEIEIRFVNNTESYLKKISDFQKPLSLITKHKDSINNDKKGLLEEFNIIEDDIKIFNVSYFYPNGKESIVKGVKPPEHMRRKYTFEKYEPTFDGELLPYHEEMINNGGEVMYYPQDEIYKMKTFFDFKNILNKLEYSELKKYYWKENEREFLRISLDDTLFSYLEDEKYQEMKDFFGSKNEIILYFELKYFIINEGFNDFDNDYEQIVDAENFFNKYEIIAFPSLQKEIKRQLSKEIELNLHNSSNKEVVSILIEYVYSKIASLMNLRNVYKKYIIDEILDNIKSKQRFIYKELNKITNLNSFRGIPERFLKQSEPLSDLDKALSNLQSDEKNKENIERWLLEFGLDKNIEVGTIESIGSYIKITEKNESRSIVDVGFGYSQLLPILILSQYSKILMVEEPEAHLHPNFQSILADFFSKMIDEPFNTSFGKYTKRQFVLETHSEYMIRKFQYLVAKKELKPEDIVIYYFGTDPTKEDYIREIRINEFGQLSSDFGEGFMDEASRLITYLWDIDRDN